MELTNKQVHEVVILCRVNSGNDELASIDVPRKWSWWINIFLPFSPFGFCPNYKLNSRKFVSIIESNLDMRIFIRMICCNQILYQPKWFYLVWKDITFFWRWEDIRCFQWRNIQSSELKGLLNILGKLPFQQFSEDQVELLLCFAVAHSSNGPNTGEEEHS